MDIPAQPKASPWPAWAKEMAPRNLERHPALFRDFAEWMKRRAEPIWVGREGRALPRDEHDMLRKQLCETARSASAETILVDWWDRLISAGNVLVIWKIELLPPIVRLPAVRPTFVRRDFHLLRAFRAYEAAFLHRLSEGISQDKLMDAVLCSAATFGGLVASGSLAALMSIGADAVASHDGRLRIMLPIAMSEGAVLKQRWYPDALTAALLVRAIVANCLPTNAGPAGLEDRQVLDRLESALDSLGISAFDKAGRDFLRGSRTAQALHVSPYISAYLAGDSSSRSLPDPVLRRLNGWRGKEQDAASGREPTVQLSNGIFQKPEINYDPTKKPVDQIRAIRAVNAILIRDRDVVGRLEAYLTTNRSILWPITVLLIEWVKWLVGAHDQTDPVRSSSARRYLGAIARHLIDVTETEQPLEMDPEDFETIYELAGARVLTDTERAVFWGRIRSFHDFLYLCGAPEIDLQELDGYIGVGEAGVSANLIGEADFLTFKKALLAEEESPEREARVGTFLVGMLGFRCGLRRREVQMLWLHDFHPGPDPYLVVRPSSLATLKTNAAQRRIPLKPLVPKDELSLLSDLAERRREVLGKHKGLLFAHPHTPLIPLPSAALFDPVTLAFQSITGTDGPRFRFHHLRHSLANWLFLALLAADQPQLIDRDLDMFSAHLLALGQVSMLKDAFFPRLPGTPPAPTRRNLYLVSALLGHLSPATTLKSYIHLLDWLAGQECDQALEERIGKVGARTLGVFCGLSPSMPHKAPYRDLVEYPVEFLRRFAALHLPKEFRESPVADVPANGLSLVLDMIGKDPVPHPVTMMILLGRVLNKAPVEELERIHGVSRVAIKKVHQAYRQMYAKQSVKKPKPEVPVPSPPRTAEDQREFWRIIDAAYRSYESQANRPAMVAAADALIRRTGPRTGRIYLGRQPDEALLVVDGLHCMGIGPALLSLVVRMASESLEERPEIEEIAETLAERGVEAETTNLDWPVRKEKGALLRLDVGFAQSDDPGKFLKHQVGRIRGLNYAAAWIRFVSNLHCAEPTQD